MAHARRERGRTRPHGIALVDALLAMAVLAVAALLMTRWVGAWQHGADQARADAEALRLAGATLEAARGRAALEQPDGSGLLQIADGEDVRALGVAGRYRRSWWVDEATGPAALRRVGVDVLPDDAARPSEPLRAVGGLLAVDARDSAEALRRAAPSGLPWTPWRRHASIPATATVMAGDGTAAARSAIAAFGRTLLLSDLDGRVVSRCDDARSGAVCVALDAVLVGGYVHAAADARISLTAQPAGAGSAAPQCELQAVADDWAGDVVRTGRRVWSYLCLLPTAAGLADRSASWSGRLRLSSSDGASDCGLASSAGVGSRPVVAGSYTGLAASLANENHWLVRDGACPAGSLPVPTD